MTTKHHITLALTILAAASAACSSAGEGEGKTFVLVHGAWMGAAGWDRVADRLRAAPLATPVMLTGGAFGTLPRSYLATTRDRVVSPDLQSRMAAATPMDREVTLDISHVPMLAAPDAVADALLAE